MRNELLEEFAGFTEIDSVSFGERRMADLLKEKLRALGFETEEDDAGSHYGGNAGNVYGFLKGSLSGEPVLFSAHMDTVEPGIGKKAVFQEDGRITSDGTTVLGADDAAGLTEILGGIRRVLSSGKPHRDIEVLFPIAEEVYTKGTRVFDFSKIRSKEAYVLDLSGPVGSAAVQAPSLISFVLTIHGKAAHAGFEPEKGIHAVTAAALAIARLPQGHVEEDTTLNIGLIRGGTAHEYRAGELHRGGRDPKLQPRKSPLLYGGGPPGYSGRKRKNQAALWRTRFPSIWWPITPGKRRLP